jgi:PAS domain S-box-containing protein
VDFFLQIRPARRYLAALLVCLLAAEARAAEAPSNGFPVLTNVTQVRQLEPERAKRGLPVKLRGVITYAHRGWLSWFLQDETAGIYFYRQDEGGQLRAGQEIELLGKTIQGVSGPAVKSEQIQILGQRAMPAPKLVSAAQLLEAQYDGQWVEIVDFVRSVGQSGSHLEFRMGRRTRFPLSVTATNGQTAPLQLVEGMVRVQGVAVSALNSAQQRTGARIFTPSLDYVSVVTPGPGDPFNESSVPAANLRQKTNGLSPDRRVKVEGMVTQTRGNGHFFLQDDSGGLLVKPRQKTKLQTGDRVAVAGYPAWPSMGVSLDEAEVQRVEAGTLPAAPTVLALEAVTGRHDGELLRVEAHLMAQLILPDRLVLVMRSGKTLFEAYLEGTNAAPTLAACQQGSILAVTGVCLPGTEEQKGRHTFRVLLHGPEAVKLVSGPTWWTVGHVAALLGTLLAVFLVRLGLAHQQEARLIERHRQLFENSSDIIYTHDLDGNITSLNPAGKRLMGQPRQEEARLNVRDMLPPDKRERWRELVDRIIRGELNGPLEIQIITAAGLHKSFEATFRVVRLCDRPVAIEGIARDVTERLEAEKSLRSSREQLRSLAAKLQSVREEERTRIAREVHDELGQSLTGLKLDISSIASRLPAGEAALRERASPMARLIDESIQKVRTIATDLRPGILDNLGLVAALEWQAEEFQTRTGVKCDFVAKLDDDGFSPELCTALFRIFQETLTNVTRHAQATLLAVTLKELDGELWLEVRDNGLGINERQINWRESLGLLGMRERALAFGGEVAITGAPGLGTTVTVRVPLVRVAA